MNTTPISLLQQLRSPDADKAWTEFVQLYTPLLAHWARRLGVEADHIADFLQDVFVRLLQALPQFEYEPGRRFRGWLWTLVRNSVIQRHRQRLLPVAPDVSTDGLLDDGPEDHLAESEYQAHLMARALDIMRVEFHPTTWKACWAVVVEGKAVKEVASDLGLTPNAVYVARSRVLRCLRERLEGLLD